MRTKTALTGDFALSNDNSLIALATWRGVQIVDTRNHERILPELLVEEFISHVAISPQGDRVLARTSGMVSTGQRWATWDIEPDRRPLEAISRELSQAAGSEPMPSSERAGNSTSPGVMLSRFSRDRVSARAEALGAIDLLPVSTPSAIGRPLNLDASAPDSKTPGSLGTDQDDLPGLPLGLQRLLGMQFHFGRSIELRHRISQQPRASKNLQTPRSRRITVGSRLTELAIIVVVAEDDDVAIPDGDSCLSILFEYHDAEAREVAVSCGALPSMLRPERHASAITAWSAIILWNYLFTMSTMSGPARPSLWTSGWPLTLVKVVNPRPDAEVSSIQMIAGRIAPSLITISAITSLP
jgi:hypothetical protein